MQQLMVVTGIHHIFNFLEIQLLANFGKNVLNALISVAAVAQAGAALAVGFKTKNNKLKAIALPSALSASLGITEAAIFGVNLIFVRPFFCALIGAATGGFFSSVFNIAGTGMSITALPGMLLYIANGQLLLYILSIMISSSVAFILTYMFGYDDKMLEEK